MENQPDVIRTSPCIPLSERQRKILNNVHAHANLPPFDGQPRISCLREGWKKIQQIHTEPVLEVDDSTATAMVQCVMLATGAVLVVVAAAIIAHGQQHA